MAEHANKDFMRQLAGYGLTTAEIFYRLPDHPAILQTYIWQEYDLSPAFPELTSFLSFWEKNLDGPLHSVRVAHQGLLRPVEWNAVAHSLTLH